MTRVCDIDECERKHLARGLCGTHYNQTHQTNRHPSKQVECIVCGTRVTRAGGGGRKHGYTCSNDCRSAITPPRAPTKCELPADHWARMYGATSAWPKGRDTWSPLREALFVGDHDAVITAIREDSTVTDTGCWQWGRRINRGYPEVQVGQVGKGKPKTYQVHRLALEAKHGRELGKQAAHHVCANSVCVNPAHLQPVSHVDNNVEMMQRTYFMARIDELEAALHSLAPGHHLLAQVGLPLA